MLRADRGKAVVSEAAYEARRSFDVTEEEGHGALRQRLATHKAIFAPRDGLLRALTPVSAYRRISTRNQLEACAMADPSGTSHTVSDQKRALCVPAVSQKIPIAHAVAAPGLNLTAGLNCIANGKFQR